MSLEIKTDLEGVNFEQLAEVYRLAFNGIQTAELIETVFRRSYATRVGIWNERIVSGVYAFSDGVLDASIHGLCVHPDFQRLGIGRQVMLSLLEDFGPEIALLMTAEEKHWDFYRSVGFKRLNTAMARGFPEGDMET